ncbi:F-box/kelch-repeat protein [Apostasia shenzhenica]|uniref:F-box/kelch-repeat protein n=1 Tax=Apostasia shenzhenica TaxID=1088818 RepID=A0A2I0B6L8_9ASPA|nr:F-box/kelch-repeat protein [Apostasia shenzhenica]
MENLIPGLPEDIAVECLVRLPHQSFSHLRRVCRRWKQELDSPLFHRFRRSAGFSRSFLVLAQADPPAAIAGGPAHKHSASFPSYRLALLDPSTGEWDSLPQIPASSGGIPLFCGLAAAGRELVVVGGWDPDTWVASDSVYIYNFIAGAWRHGRPMPGPRRSFFACAGSSSGLVFVAGGHDEEKNALRSAYAYDVARDEWAQLPDMARERDECAGMFIAGGGAGLFRVVGGYSTAMQGRFDRSGEEFDTINWKWQPVEEAAMDAEESPRSCAAGRDGRMYLCSSSGRVVSAAEGEGWKMVAEVPEDAMVAAQMVACGGSLVVMGAGSHGMAPSAYVLELKQARGWSAAEWRRLEMPPEYSGHVHGGCCFEI